MNERRFLIEVLLRARETVSQIAQRVVRSLDSVTASQKRSDQAVKSSQSTIRNQVTALEQLRTAHIREKRELDRLQSAHGGASRSVGRFTSALNRMGISTDRAKSGLRGLNAEFQGFQIALAIKYAQSLISVLVALAAQLFAVAAAAGQAAIGIGAALAGGAAQAVPAVGVLVAAFARLAAVLKVVKLSNQQQLTATHDATRAAKAQRTAIDQVRAAEQRVADAHRNTARAIQDLTRTRGEAAREEVRAQQEINQARHDAIRTVQDLMAAEEDAAQSLEQARVRRRQAIEAGDVTGAVQADVDITRSRGTLRRARQDVAPARARGVEGIEAVQQAEQRLADTRRSGARQIQQAEERLGDARRDERKSTDDLSHTRRESADNVAQETAAVDKLADSLAQLSPAERELYRRIIALQEVYRRVARPITDILVRAFTDVVNRVNQLIQDPRIIRGFRNIAIQIAASIRTATSEAGGPRSVGAFQILSAEAARNIPIATRILVNFFRAVRNLVLDALPAFRLLLSYVEDYSNQALDASRNSRGITEFFRTGVRYAKAFFDLGLAVVGLFLALAGRGGAASEGIRTINDLTDVIDGLTDKVRHNAGRIRGFFAETHDAFFAVLSVVGTLGAAIVNAFSARSVQTFADFLNRVIIPALSNTIQIMGYLVTAFHAIFSVPLIAQAAEMAATVLLLMRGLTVIRTAIGSIIQIIPNFLRAMGLMVTAEEAAAGGFLALTGIGEVILVIAAVIAAVVLLDRKLHFLGPTWRWLKNAAENAWQAIKHAARDVVNWFSDVWTQGLLYWLRQPFVWAARHLGGPAFGWLRDAVHDITNFLKRYLGGGGFWGGLFDAFMAPFRALRAGVRLTFHLIRTVVETFLDVIAGRFDEVGETIKGFWDDLLDTLAGGVTSLLGIMQKLLGGLGEIPKIGGPFKDAAEDIKRAREEIDGMRESNRRHRNEQEKSNKVVEASLPTLVRLRTRYEDAHDRLEKLTPGTKRYRDAVKDAREASRHYNDALKTTADKAGGAQQPVGKLRRNIKNLGDVSGDTADVVAKNLNDVLRQVGARTIRLNTRAYRHSGIDVITEATGHGATGGVLSRAHGLRRRLWGGGVPNPYGGAADDHVLLSPQGMPVAALSGSEGIINTPQMGVINNALSFTQQMTGTPWGSLNDLWGSGMRHFQGGGGLQPAIRTLSNRLDRMFGLQTTSTTGGQHAANSYHYLGLAADISGGQGGMARAVSYLKRSGLTRALLEGIHNPGLSIKNGRPVSPSFWGSGTWSNHMNHIHLALRSLSARLSDVLDASGIGRVRTPQIRGLGDDALSRIARGSARLLTRAANRYLRRQQLRLGGGDPMAMGADANVVVAFRRAMRFMGANAKERLAGWEAGIVESGLRNLHFGDADSLGALQERASIFGRAHALNPFASMVRFLRDAISRRPWRGTAGALAQAVQRSAFPGRYDAAAPQARRYLQGGGPLKGHAAPPLAATRLPLFDRILRELIRRRLAPVMDDVADLFGDVTKTLESVARGPLRRSKNLALRVSRAFARITGDNGLLDQMRSQVERVTARSALALQRLQFRITRRGPVRTSITAAEAAQAELQGLQSQRGALRDERGAIGESIEAAQRSLEVARHRHNRRAADAARAALTNLRERLANNAAALAQNAQDQVETQERFQQSLFDAVTANAERQNSAIDRWSRMAKALGQNLDPSAVLGVQANNMRNQINDLKVVLVQAERSGNVDLVNQINEQINELNVQIAEAAAQQFQNAIDAVNTAAQRQTARLDRATRIAQLGGRTDFGVLQGILGQRGDVLRGQIGGLNALLGQAQAAGNVEQAQNLIDQIEELQTQLAENTQAVRDNTDEAFNFRTQQINETFGFSQGVFQSVQGFFAAMGQRTGFDTTTQQATALQGLTGALGAQQGGLKSQLASLLGYSPSEAQSLANLAGASLVSYLSSIASGPAFDAIIARLDPTQQEAFKDLITSLLSNATATEENTKALEDLVSTNAQSFTSSFWTAFRTAVFTGAGGLLPQFAMTLPSAQIGARVAASGALMVHAGETVRPAGLARDWGGVGGGDTYNLNVTSPTEVLDPTDVGRKLAFYRKIQKK